MAGDSETGGGGSVVWAVNVDTIDPDPIQTDCRDLGNGRYHQRGRDTDHGRDFTVSIKAPSGMLASQYLPVLRAALVANDGTGRITFTLPIERNERNQIKISWGDRDVEHYQRGQGRPMALAIAPRRRRSPKRKRTTAARKGGKVVRRAKSRRHR